MKLRTGIEIGTCKLNTELLPTSLYQGVAKQWSEQTLMFPQEVLGKLQEIVENYLRIMGIIGELYPARVDIGISQTGYPIIYEITTGFVDQIGSCLALQESIGNIGARDILAQTHFDGSTLTLNQYRNEYQLMRYYFQKSGKILQEDTGESIFVYGYPTDMMRDKENMFPSWKGLEAEKKLTQTKILHILTQGTDFIVPRIFSQQDTPYESLPNELYTKLVFKQDAAKMKAARNTITFGKGKISKERYESGEMFAQEYITAYRDTQSRRYEMKALFMPTKQGSQFLGAYTLVDNIPENPNFGSMTILNDGYPQGPVTIIL